MQQPDLERVINCLERAARHLHPLIIGGDPDTRHAAHEALNALAGARGWLELAVTP